MKKADKIWQIVFCWTWEAKGLHVNLFTHGHHVCKYTLKEPHV